MGLPAARRPLAAIVGTMVVVALASCGGSRSIDRAAPSGATRGFRALQWNVSGDAWTRHAAEARAVLRHADPDLFILDEVDPALGESGVRAMLGGLRGAADTTWFVSLGAGGSYQRTAIASRDSVVALAEFALVPFPDTGGAAARAAVPDSVRSHPTRAEAATVATNGAMVRVAGRRLFVVGLDLTSSGAAGSWRDVRRQVEAVAIRERMRAVLARLAPDGVIAAGDLNLATGPAPLDTLLGSVSAPPLGPMRAADAVHHDGWTTWTWDGRGTAFNGGRLDVMTYSAGTLEPTRGRVWNTELMPPDTLLAHQLAPGTSASINRHRPVVVDFVFRAPR